MNPIQHYQAILLAKYDAMVWEHLTLRQASSRARALAALYRVHRV